MIIFILVVNLFYFLRLNVRLPKVFTVSFPVCPWRCCPWYLNCLLLFGRGASVCTLDDLFVRIHCVQVLVCFALIWLFISQPFIQFLLFVQGTSVSYVNSCKVSKCIKTATAEAPLLLWYQNFKEGIPTTLEIFLCFETKRNITRSSLKTSKNARVTSGEELGTLSKNN